MCVCVPVLHVQGCTYICIISTDVQDTTLHDDDDDSHVEYNSTRERLNVPHDSCGETRVTISFLRVVVKSRREKTERRSS